MAWFFLLLAGACEMVWPLGFKYTHGFRTHFPFVALTLGIMTLSFWLMGMATNKGIHLGTAYAVWTGMGASGAVILGIILFHEPRDWMRMMFLGFIIVGVIGLKFLSPPSAQTNPAAPIEAVTPQP